MNMLYDVNNNIEFEQIQVQYSNNIINQGFHDYNNILYIFLKKRDSFLTHLTFGSKINKCLLLTFSFIKLYSKVMKSKNM